MSCRCRGCALLVVCWQISYTSCLGACHRRNEMSLEPVFTSQLSGIRSYGIIEGSRALLNVSFFSLFYRLSWATTATPPFATCTASGSRPPLWRCSRLTAWRTPPQSDPCTVRSSVSAVCDSNAMHVDPGYACTFPLGKETTINSSRDAD